MKCATELFLLLAATIVFAIDLPKAPPGFTWQEIPELKAGLLKPDGWHFKREAKEGTLAYFITKEDIDQKGGFQTGLSVNVFHLKKDQSVQRARDLIEQLAAKKHVQVWSRDVGTLKEFGCRIKNTDASGTIISHNLTVANPKTNILYLFIYESPETEWEVAWKAGETIMNMLALDDEI